jgi:hypothetical protein
VIRRFTQIFADGLREFRDGLRPSKFSIGVQSVFHPWLVYTSNLRQSAKSADNLVLSESWRRRTEQLAGATEILTFLAFSTPERPAIPRFFAIFLS